MISTDPARPVDRPLALRYTLANTTPKRLNPHDYSTREPDSDWNHTGRTCLLATDRTGRAGGGRCRGLLLLVVLLGGVGASLGGAGAVVLGVGDEVEVLVGVAVGALPGELAAATALLGVAAHAGGRLAVAAVVRGDLVRVPALLGAVHGCCSDRWRLCNYYKRGRRGWDWKLLCGNWGASCFWGSGLWGLNL
ncbi:hypothetical protein C2845_PM05G26140 [Panicum miliaceum]|uniref:Uncharacterized protein n=1 Tax=Panicum miliaceum TaxID=4540 RepID=A0A3L6SZ62_PANMI|nr:hypothetical protein C2845_PM05G26140 [Panicum miliaceum]